MEYVEHAAPADLRRHVQCLWILRDDAPGDAIQVIYPDGRCELLAELGVPLRFHGPDGEIRVDQVLAFAGQQLGPIRLQATGAVHCIGVRLSAASGSLVALMSIAQASAALLLPALAARQRDRRPWLWLTLLLQAAGFASFAYWPDLAPRSFAMISGVGLGGWFALTLVVALDHLPEPERAGALSALMQGGGFLLAASAPWLSARLHDATGSFGAGWVMHLAFVAVVFLLTVRLAPGRYAAAMAGKNA